MNGKFLIGGLIGGVLFFVLGWLMWGTLLASMMERSMMAGFYKSMEELNWIFMILGNLAWGFMMTYILTISNRRGFSAGATVGAVLGFLICAAFDFEMYGVSNMYNSLHWIFVDLLANMVVFGISGGVVGWWRGRGK